VIGSFGGPDVSPDGLELTVFKVSTPKSVAQAGGTVTVSFTLKNASGNDIAIGPVGIFVGTRWNSTSDTNNRDFGHKFMNKLLKPGQSVHFTASRKLDAAGTWRFWPAYQYSGHWGPFRWHEIVIETSEGQTGGSTLKTLGQCRDSKGSQDGLSLKSFEVMGPNKPARNGVRIVVKYRLNNNSGRELTFKPHGVFVGARWNSTTDANNRDFGHQQKGAKISSRPSDNSIVLEAETTLNAAGTWRFWPAYMVDGHWGPFRWCEVVVRASGSRQR
jgi:hypothetical protein